MVQASMPTTQCGIYKQPMSGLQSLLILKPKKKSLKAKTTLIFVVVVVLFVESQISFDSNTQSKLSGGCLFVLFTYDIEH